MKRLFSSDKNKNRLFQNQELDLELTNPSNDIKLPLTSKNIFKNNGGNIMFNPMFTSPNSTKKEKEHITDLFNLETKINSLESKLFMLEQTNENLKQKINNNEQNFELKIKKLEKNNFEEKKNLKKAENNLALLSKLNNDNNIELKKKLSFIHNNIQKEEENKNEQRKFDMEIQKNFLNNIAEKLKETIKLEIDERFKADIENKIYNENMYKNTEGEFNKIKKEIEDINNNILSKIKLLSKECSERSHNVSKYIDNQITNALLGKNDILDNIKKYMEQLILQVKNNISTQNEQNKLFDSRLKEIEVHLEKNKNDNYGYMSEVENRFDKKFKNLKNYFELNIKKHDYFLDNLMKNFAFSVDKNFNFISNIIVDIRQKENETFIKFSKKSDEKFNSIVNDLEKICERIYQYENSLNVFDKQNNLLKKNISESLISVKTRLDVHRVHQKILYTVENNFMQDQVTFLQKKLESTNNDLITNINLLQQNSNNSINNLVENLEKIKNNVEKNELYNKKKIQNLENRNEENDVKQVMEEIMNNIENINLINSLQNSKSSEYTINKLIQEQQTEINKLNTNTQLNQQKNNELNIKLNNLEKNINKTNSNIEQNLNQILEYQNNAKEIEITDAVNNIMNKMISNIETELTKEKMDDLSKFDLTQMSNNLSTLSDKINLVDNSTKANSEQISDIQLSLKNIEQKTLNSIKNSKNSDLNIKLAMNQMLNNVEFNNIYSLLKSEKNVKNFEYNDEFRQKCGEIVDNKIQVELEKIKIENENLWKKAIEANEKLNKPGEIKEIIDNVPATVIPLNDSAKRIMDVDYYNGSNDNPKVNNLDEKLNLINEKDKDKDKNKENEIEDNAKKNEEKNESNNNENEIKEDSKEEDEEDGGEVDEEADKKDNIEKEEEGEGEDKKSDKQEDEEDNGGGEEEDGEEDDDDEGEKGD